jgi:uncharacterized protein YoaH (UPF0181 family)
MDREEYDRRMTDLMADGLPQHEAAYQIAKQIDEEANKKYHEVAGLWVEEDNPRVAFKSSFKGLPEKVKIPKGAVLIAFTNDTATKENQQPNYHLCWTFTN